MCRVFEAHSIFIRLALCRQWLVNKDKNDNTDHYKRVKPYVGNCMVSTISLAESLCDCLFNCWLLDWLHLFNLGLEWMWSGSSSHHCPYLTHTHTQAITTRARKPSCPRNTDCIRKIKVCCQRCYPCLPTDIPGIWGFAEKRPFFRKPRHIDRINLERCDSEPNFILGLQPTPASQKGWHKFLKRNSPIRFFRPTFFS